MNILSPTETPDGYELSEEGKVEKGDIIQYISGHEWIFAGAFSIGMPRSFYFLVAHKIKEPA